MLGAIAGDIIGSVYEFQGTKRTDFPLFDPHCTFTDDTVLTVATADVLLHGGDYASAYKSYARKHSGKGYGGGFGRWAASDQQEPYGSFGNGSAMRVGPVGWAFDTLDETLEEAKRSAEVTHSHPEGIKGAQAVACAVFLARTGTDKEKIRAEVAERFDYWMDRTVDEIRPKYRFDETCMGTVPEAIIAFLESDGVENAIRLGISLGGDADTIGCITGSIAEAFYGKVPDDIVSKVVEILDEDLLAVTREFCERFVCQYSM